MTGYREASAGVSGVVAWQREAMPDPSAPSRILPDGCMDLIWDGTRLFVAGPDRVARLHTDASSASYAALRFADGTGPAMVGVPADTLTDLTVDLADLWPSRRAAELEAHVAEDPLRALVGWARQRSTVASPDPLGPAVRRMAAAGTDVATMADRVGFSTRQLHRRCLRLFGYGPKHLVRVLRLGRALELGRDGLGAAEVAVAAGYADQPHFARDTRTLALATPRALLAPLSRAPRTGRRDGRPGP